MSYLRAPRLLVLAAAASLAWGATAVHAQKEATAAATAASAASPYAVREPVGKGLQEAIDLYKANKVAEAHTRITTLQAATPDAQPQEATAMHRIRGLLELQQEQLPAAVKSLEAAMAVNVQPPQDALQTQEALARAQFNLKNYAAAADWSRKAQAAGSKAAVMQTVLVRSTYLLNDFPGAIKLLEAQHKATPLGMEDLRLLASAYGQAKDEPNYVRLTEQLLREHKRTEYWPDLLSRVQMQPGWQERWEIDAYRLRMALDMMDEVDDYLVLADLAARSGLPAEAQKVLETGIAKGVLGKGGKAAEHQKFLASVTKQANDDRSALAASAQRAPAVTDAKSANNAFNTGAALVSIGQTERGLEYMKAALGGTLADPAQARLQYAQALQRAGRTAEAAEQFKAAESMGLLARLWPLAVAQPPAQTPAQPPAQPKKN